MKIFKIITYTLLAILLLSCQSKTKIDHRFLIGKWQASDITGIDRDTLFGESLLMNPDDQIVIEFTKDTMYMDSTEASHYQFIVKDSSLTLYQKEAAETIMLHVLNQDEFETKDNMGLIMVFKRTE
ncbi:hypothetical protein [Aquimarina algiphila]|uniref:hypothetical protein n=1 Tax=Aquimarina algiphila TaxID=2047982 RepID=UPI00232C9BDF|nr:hypothetical protein [Aquimarina algiphila]